MGKFVIGRIGGGSGEAEVSKVIELIEKTILSRLF
jgi:hypothetical protein